MNIINTDFLKKIPDGKKIMVLTVAFIVGVILMIIPSGDESADYKQTDDTCVKENIHNAGNSNENLESELEAILSLVEGVGEVRALIKYKPTFEKSTFSANDFSSENNQPEEVFNNIEGVIIAAQGGGSQKIKFELTEAVSELLGIPAHKVNILKMNRGGN